MADDVMDKSLDTAPGGNANQGSGGALLRPISIFILCLLGASSIGMGIQAAIYPALSKIWWTTASAAFLLLISTGLCLWISVRRIRSVNFQSILILTSVFAAMTALSALITDTGIPAGLICLIFSITIAYSAMASRYSETVITLGICVSIAISLLNLYSPFEQVSLPWCSTILAGLSLVLVVVFFALIFMNRIAATLRIKLLTISLAFALIPLAVLAILQNNATQKSLQQQNFSGLRSAALQTVTDVDNLITSISTKVETDARLEVFIPYLDLPAIARKGSFEEGRLKSTWAVIGNDPQKNYITSIALLDKNGLNLYDTEHSRVGASEALEDYFSQPVLNSKSYISPLRFASDGKSTIVFSSPIVDHNKVVGVLRFVYLGRIFQNLIESDQDLYGTESSPILIDENLLRIGDADNPGRLYQPLVSYTVQEQNGLIANNRLPSYFSEFRDVTFPEYVRTIQSLASNSNFTYIDPQSSPTIPYAGVIVKTNRTSWYVAYVQRQDFQIGLARQQSRLSQITALLIASLVVIAATFVARLLSNPITRLTSTVEKITNGDLNVNVDVKSKDEIGILGQAFNQMTRQVQTLINELEQRVQSRTQELYRQNLSLQYRTQQLQTVSDVARSIASTQDLQSLLDKVAMMVSERFNFYHVGIFLLDDQDEYAVLRAANSDGGKTMLARQHRLKVGEVGIVGYAAGHGVPRIATDVDQDVTYFDNPDLPLTRSEMALPLRFNQRVIGVLDVQSTKANAFSEADVELFGILADQVAIAITNNRLYSETNQALSEIQELHRQYMRMEWDHETAQHPHPAYLYTPNGTSEVNPELDPNLESVMATGKPYMKPGVPQESPAVLAVPILLRGEPIGVIELQEHDLPDREWSADELTTVQSVADQIALALENVRLLEQTIRRADRERKVLEITSKIRATNDVQAMLSVAMEELQKALNASRAQIILENEPGSHSEKRSLNLNRLQK
jgi:GAF domain-containing protein/HAMP domain-containing protein